MKHRSYRDESRANWGTTSESPLTLEQINAGALLRIADAAELMVRRHTELIAQRDYYKGRAEAEAGYARTLGRRVAALKGQITKLKKGRS